MSQTMIIVAVVIICCCISSSIGGGIFLSTRGYSKEGCDDMEKIVVFMEDPWLTSIKNFKANKTSENRDILLDKTNTLKQMSSDLKSKHGNKSSSSCANDLNARARKVVEKSKD
jgi:hypothetical protein